MATRDAGQKAITALADVLPNLIGGSGDLDPSTRTALKGRGDFESPLFKPSEGTPATQGLVGGPTGYAGRNIHFGIREHAMAGIATGMALHGGVLPFAATFFTFSDYMRPSIRLAALSKAHVIYVWTHDSIGLGEDGPTHQPVEQLASLRALPDLTLLRPADANETVEAWKIAVAHTSGPVGLVLTRQRLPVLDRSTLSPASGVAKGAYVLSDPATGSPTVILIATGSEVPVALEAHNQLTRQGNCKPGRLDAVVGFVSVATAILPGHGSSSRRQGASQHRGRLPDRMGALRGPRRHNHRAGSLRRVGAR